MLGYLASLFILLLVYWLICTDPRRSILENFVYFIHLHFPPWFQDWLLRNDWLTRKLMGFSEDFLWRQALQKRPYLSVETIERAGKVPELVVIRPPNAKEEKLKVFYFLHGGGWCIGSAKTDLAVKICHYLNAVVISCEYRLAPEHPFPAAADDAIEGMKHVWKEIDTFGDSKQFIVGGISAGGQLTIVCAQSAKKLDIPLKVHVPLFPCVYPFPATKCVYERSLLSTPFLSEFRMGRFYQCYFGKDRTDVRANVLHGELENLSPAFVVLGKYDPLQEEGEDYVEALKEKGVQVNVEVANGGHMAFYFERGSVKKSILKLKAFCEEIDIGRTILG